jgi:hypothetical protein
MNQIFHSVYWKHTNTCTFIHQSTLTVFLLRRINTIFRSIKFGIKHWISFRLKCCRITTVYYHWNYGDPPGASHFTKCRKRIYSIFKPTSTATKSGTTTKSGTKSGTAKSGTIKSGTAKSGRAKSGTTKSGTSRKAIYKMKETSKPPWFIIANYYLLEYIWNSVVIRSYFSNFCVKKSLITYYTCIFWIFV